MQQSVDISRTNLYIGKLIKVVKSRNSVYHKPICVNGRHSDAFVYIISGSCTYSVEGGLDFTVHEGDILYLAYRSVYTMYIHTKDYEFIFCDFEFNEPAHRISRVYSAQTASKAGALFYKLLNGFNLSGREAFTECNSVLYRIYGIIQKSDDTAYISKETRTKIADAKNYIDANFNDSSLNILSLAVKSGVSEVYFRKIFKSQYKISPLQYLISVRIKNAEELMRNYPFLTLEECALQSGFSSVQYFCRVFKREMGLPPGRYRKMPTD